MTLTTRVCVLPLLYGAIALLPERAFAAHPLITEDTGTQGTGNGQVEITGERTEDSEDGKTIAPNLVVSYGVAENVDLVLGVPHSRTVTDAGGRTTITEGPGDVGLDVKWRFFEEGVLSFAVKSGLTFPTGDENEGLGAGKTGYSAFLVSTVEQAPWAFHLHLGYIANKNVVGEEEDIWHVSYAVARDIGRVKLVADLGTDTNPDQDSEVKPAFLILGLIYSWLDNVDIDVGYKKGVSDTEVDRAILAGLQILF